MHTPRSYGLHVIGGKLTADDTAFIENHARQLTNAKQLSGLDTAREVYSLPDGGTALFQDAGGVFRVITYKEVVVEKPKDETFEKPVKIPMLFSGLIIQTSHNDNYVNTPTKIRLTEQCRKRLNNYADNQPIPETEIGLFQFNVPTYDSDEVWFDNRYDYEYPTLYSGAMSQVVQIVSGYGITDPALIPTPTESVVLSPYEQAQMLIPKEVYDDIKEEIAKQNIGLRVINMLENKSGINRFGFSYSETDIISFDTDNQPWLVRICELGIYAMRLPMISETTTKAFRRYIESVNDTEILAILDKFGGMPSGASFPSLHKNDDTYYVTEMLINAGLIIRLCDTDGFNGYLPYSDDLGVTTNSKGDEGYCTCFNYVDTDNYARGYTFKINLDISHIKETTPLDISQLNDDDSNYLAKMAEFFISESFEALTVKAKMDYAGLSVIKDRANQAAINGFDINTEYTYWTDLVADPIAKHTGEMFKIETGYLYYYPIDWSNYQPQFMPLDAYSKNSREANCFAPKNRSWQNNPPICDTTVMVYYENDVPRKVKYYADFTTWSYLTNKKTSDLTLENIFPEPFASVNTGYGNDDRPAFYIENVIDERIDYSVEENAVSSRGTTTYEFEDYGYDKKHRFYFENTNMTPVYGGVFRYRFFRKKETIDYWGRGKNKIAVCVPISHRNMVVYASRYEYEEQRTTIKYTMHAVQDKKYDFWTIKEVTDQEYNSWGNYYPTLFSMSDVTTPRSYHPAYVYLPKRADPEHEHYDPDYLAEQESQLSEMQRWAISGNWLGVGKRSDVSSYADFYTMSTVGSSWNSQILYGMHDDQRPFYGAGFGGEVPIFDLPNSDTGRQYKEPTSALKLCTNDQGVVALQHDEKPISAYFSQIMGALNCFVSQNCFGSTKFLNFGDTLNPDDDSLPDNQRPIYRQFGSCKLLKSSDTKRQLYFIGVINE